MPFIDAAPFAGALLVWYDQHAAAMPWRADNPNPYHVWLSEIMLQQTQVATVEPYFERFISAYPTVQHLAQAPLDDVLKLWEGLGYYSRARNLHKTANLVADKYFGKFPQTVDELMTLSGIGRYTAGAIASIAFGAHAPVLDGNVIRVFARLLDLTDDVSHASTQRALWTQAEAWVPATRSGDYNQALMELGRTVCKPRAPLCEECPIQAHCVAFANGTQAARPVKAKKPPTPHYDVAAGIIRDDDGRILITQRPMQGLLGGLWEFPGGKQEPDETLPECLARELQEELGVTVNVGAFFVKVKHAFTHFKITLHAFDCRIIDGEPQCIGVQDWVWIKESDFDRYSFGKADREIIAALRSRGQMLL